MHMLARPMGPLIVQPLRLNVRVQAAGRGKGRVWHFVSVKENNILDIKLRIHGDLPLFFPLTIAGSSFKSGGGGRGGGRENGGGIPPWKRYTKKTLGRQAEATLESVWMRTQWPSDDTIASLWNLHRLRRDQVLTWFQDKRKKERGGGGGSKASSSGDRSISGSDTIGGPKTDWDAEWGPLEADEEEDEEEAEIEM
jgi:hypothetical protein